jgi:N6-adenosine-specific RNA methylase IME4
LQQNGTYNHYLFARSIYAIREKSGETNMDSNKLNENNQFLFNEVNLENNKNNKEDINNTNDQKTGYSVYQKKYNERKKINLLSEIFPPLPSEQYDIIYADPPWDYNGKMQFDRNSVNKDEIDLSKNIFISSASMKYPTLKLGELKKLDVNSIATENSLLFMWATNPFLDQAIELGTAWGFEYRTVIFIWNKMVHNPGKYNLSYCELCLLFKKGKIPTPRGVRNTKQLINVPRSKHSEKPIEVANNIVAMFPHHKRIELFARKTLPDWSYWGLEITKDDVSNIGQNVSKVEKDLWDLST